MRRGKTLVVILAGGVGGRLDVLTERRAKPAMPFGGTYRLIDFALSNCVHSGQSDVWVVEQYRPHTLNDHLANGRPWDLDRTYGGLQVLPPYTDRDGGQSGESGFAQGNADALYRQRHFIAEFDPELLIVLSADHVYKLDYRDVVDRHLEAGAEVTMVTTAVDVEEASRFGVVRADTDGRVEDFAYKPERPPGNVVTTEVFVYDARTLLETLDGLAAAHAAEDHGGEEDPGGLRDFGHELLPELVRRGRAFAYPFDGYWRDVGTVESYWAGHMELLAEEPKLSLDDPRWPILTYGSQRLPARVHAEARIENSLISPGCVVRGRVVRSVLGPGVVIREGAVVRDSVILHDTRVEVNARVSNAIIDERVSVGASAVVGSIGRGEATGSGVESESKITLVGMGCEVPRDVNIDAGARLKPGGRVE